MPVRAARRSFRSRIEANGEVPWKVAEEACEADLATSHLFSPDDIGELDAIQASQVGRFICECDDRPPIAIEIE